MKTLRIIGFCALAFICFIWVVSPINAQDPSPTSQPDIEAALSALPITVHPEAYSRDCRPVHTLLLDSDDRAYLEAPNFSLGEQQVVITDYGTRYDNAGWQYVPQTISTVDLTAADGQIWIPLIPSEQAITVSLPGRIDLPPAAESYRYLRLHLDGDVPLALTEAEVVLAADSYG